MSLVVPREVPDPALARMSLPDQGLARPVCQALGLRVAQDPKFFLEQAQMVPFPALEMALLLALDLKAVLALDLKAVLALDLKAVLALDLKAVLALDLEAVLAMYQRAALAHQPELALDRLLAPMARFLAHALEKAKADLDQTLVLMEVQVPAPEREPTSLYLALVLTDRVAVLPRDLARVLMADRAHVLEKEPTYLYPVLVPLKDQVTVLERDLAIVLGMLRLAPVLEKGPTCLYLALVPLVTQDRALILALLTLVLALKKLPQALVLTAALVLVLVPIKAPALQKDQTALVPGLEMAPEAATALERILTVLGPDLVPVMALNLSPAILDLGLVLAAARENQYLAAQALARESNLLAPDVLEDRPQTLVQESAPADLDLVLLKRAQFLLPVPQENLADQDLAPRVALPRAQAKPEQARVLKEGQAHRPKALENLDLVLEAALDQAFVLGIRAREHDLTGHLLVALTGHPILDLTKQLHLSLPARLALDLKRVPRGMVLALALRALQDLGQVPRTALAQALRLQMNQTVTGLAHALRNLHQARGPKAAQNRALVQKGRLAGRSLVPGLKLRRTLDLKVLSALALRQLPVLGLG